MGLRFRKSIKIAPGLKINLNKNSVSATVGTRGAHYTINSKGKKTASVGIPGTGLSYTSTSGSSSSNSRTSQNKINALPPDNTTSNNDKKWYQKTGWIIFWLICFFPIGLFLMWKYSNWNKFVKVGVSALFAIALVMPSSSDLEKITLAADTSQNYDINEDILIECSTTPSDYTLTKSDFILSGGTLEISNENIVFSASEPGTYNIYAENSEIKSNELTIVIEDKGAIAQAEAEEEAKKKAEEEAKKQAEEEARKQAELEAQQQAAVQQSSSTDIQQPNESTPIVEPEEPTVYITNTGDKYHRAGCRYLKDSKIEKKLSEVAGKAPCGVCNPPTQ